MSSLPSTAELQSPTASAAIINPGARVEVSSTQNSCAPAASATYHLHAIPVATFCAKAVAAPTLVSDTGPVPYSELLQSFPQPL